MNRSVSRLQFSGFIAVSGGGVLLHFLYDLTGESILAAPFSGINESIWEHMKLLYFPMFFFALFENRHFKERKDFWGIKLAGTAAGLLLIPVIFCTYNGTIGKSPDWLNIAIFFISAALALLLETHLFRTESVRCSSQWFAFALLCLIGLAFVLFTFRTPQHPLFRDPISGTYGL